MVRVFYSMEYVGSAEHFDTTRKARWIAESLAASPIPGIELVEPPPVTREQVVGVHDEAYVRAVEVGIPRWLAESQGFKWDPGLWRMVLASNGGAVAAALDALENERAGSLSSGLHHARGGTGAGFCTFNGLVMAAVEALTVGAGSVLILDLDAHCGGGTRSLIEGEPRIWQLDVAVSSYDSYDSSERSRLAIVDDGSDYLSTIERCIDELDRRGPRFDLCVYNAGMDPVESCAIGGMSGITRDTMASRERLIFDWARARDLPLAFVLAGGYVGGRLDQHGLVDLHRLTLATAVEGRRVFERSSTNPSAHPTS